MINKYNELIKLYEELYGQTLSISELLKVDNNAEEIETAVKNKGLLISSMDDIILSSTFSDEEKICVNNYVQKIKVVELENMSLMQKRHVQLAKDIYQNAVNTRVALIYGEKKKQAPVHFDQRE